MKVIINNYIEDIIIHDMLGSHIDKINFTQQEIECALIALERAKGRLIFLQNEVKHCTLKCINNKCILSNMCFRFNRPKMIFENKAKSFEPFQSNGVWKCMYFIK